MKAEAKHSGNLKNLKVKLGDYTTIPAWNDITKNENPERIQIE
jgi:hypothetical protein